MPTHFSPATTFVNFKIESVPLSNSVSRLEVLATGGHRLAAAGLRAILSRMNTYYGSTLTAAQVQAIQNVAPGMDITLGGVRCSFTVNTADILGGAQLGSGIQTDLQGASAVVNG